LTQVLQDVLYGSSCKNQQLHIQKEKTILNSALFMANTLSKKIGIIVPIRVSQIEQNKKMRVLLRERTIDFI